MRFRAPRACSNARVPGTNVPVRTSRLRRFDALDGFHTCKLCPDFSRHPLVGFTLRSFSRSPGPYRLSLSSREPYCRRAVTPARSRYPRAISWRAAVELLRPWHSPFGFRVLLPLRVRPPCTAVTPFTARCFPGFRLPGDFSLHAPNPPSRICRSRTCTSRPCDHDSAVPQRFGLREDQLVPPTFRIAPKPLPSDCCPLRGFCVCPA